LVRKSQQKLVIFVGSSKEGVRAMNKIVWKLEKINCTVKKWNRDTFDISETTIANLENMLDESDFGIIILSPDDKQQSRGKKYIAPRDKLIFELGLLMGKISRHRTFHILTNAKIKLPSDLHGITFARLNDCETIIKKIKKLSCR
jgi:predicted nucleotide-binding protein